jgi:hypothetical protein
VLVTIVAHNPGRDSRERNDDLTCSRGEEREEGIVRARRE